jgi:hypothetical protein
VKLPSNCIYEVCSTSYIPYICKRCPTICSECKRPTFHDHLHLRFCHDVLLIQLRSQLAFAYNWTLPVELMTHWPEVNIFTTPKWLVGGDHPSYHCLLIFWAIYDIRIHGNFGIFRDSQLFISFSYKMLCINGLMKPVYMPGQHACAIVL